jgi:hypothetical protein
MCKICRGQHSAQKSVGEIYIRPPTIKNRIPHSIIYLFYATLSGVVNKHSHYNNLSIQIPVRFKPYQTIGIV